MMRDMKKILNNMVKVDDRKILRQGTSFCINLPPSPLRDAGIEKGDTVSVYSNGDGQLLIDLKPDEE